MDQEPDEENRNPIDRGIALIIPIRCFTCGNLVADKWDEFKSRVDSGEDPQKVFEDIGLKRYCCRRMLLSHVELVDELLKFPEAARAKKIERESQ